MLAFITGPIGKIIGVLALLGMLYGAVSAYNSHIAGQERLKNQNAQLLQNEKDKQELEKKNQELEASNRDILADAGTKNEKVVERYNEVRTYIQSPEGQSSNRPTSDVIKNTIRMLRDEE